MNKFDETAVEKAPMVPSCRLCIAIMVMIAIAFLYILRIILSMSMICMVQPIPVPPVNCSAFNDSAVTLPPACNFTSFETTTVSSEESADLVTGTAAPKRVQGEFAWTRQYQGTIISCYFFGYGSTQILGGVLSGRFGAKHVLGTGVLVSVLITFITPVVTRASSTALIVLRIMLGAAGGVFLPCGQSFMGRWAPKFERSTLVSLTFLGITLGNIVAYVISPLMCGIELDNGWPWSFYLTGTLGLIFWVCWQFFVFSSPDEHPRISSREKIFIKDSIGATQVHIENFGNI